MTEGNDQGMEYFLAQLIQPSDVTLFSFADVLMAMVVSALLCLILCYTYRQTHRGVSYSQAFMITMFLMGVTTSVVMLIIGSNIARAFSLVGALSIIRFRTAMKDPRDTGFLFAAMIAGMGCGTQFYMPAIMLTTFISLLVLALHYLDFGIKKRMEMVVKVTAVEKPDAQAKIDGVLSEAFSDVKQINRILDFGDDHVTTVYLARPKKKFDPKEVEAKLRGIDEVARLALYETDQHAAL